MSITAKRILADAGAVMTGLHVVYKSGRHGSQYVNKDMVNVDPVALNSLAGIMASTVLQSLQMRAPFPVHTVAGPAMGAISLASYVALQLASYEDLRVHLAEPRTVNAVYAERKEQVVQVNAGRDASRYQLMEIIGRDDPGDVRSVHLNAGDQLVVKEPGFEFKRGQLQFIKGKQVLVVEDILTTGGSARLVVQAVREAGGEVVGVAAICNRGKVTSEMVDAPELWAAMSIDMAMDEEADCPLCAAGVPITTEVGHGKEFLARKVQAG